MKKAISKLLLAAVFMLCYISAFAHDFEVDGVYYKILNSTNKTLEVTYQGSSYSSYSNEYAGEVDVPSTVTYNGATYTVVSIGSSAFRDCITLTSVTIPEGVTAINSYAFSGCVCLTSITIPESVTSIAQYAFNGCTGLSEVTIPGVTSIGNYAFAACSGVKNVAIGESITSIGAYAFSGCTGLTSITIPESTTSIGNKAFEKCTAMTTVNFNAKKCSTGNVDNPIFSNCINLSTVNIGDNVEVIPAYAFKGCSGLTSIAIPEGATSIYTYAFYGCSGIKEVTIPKSVASIDTYAFYGCSSLTSVVIPDGVTTIRDCTFYNCDSLATVEIPESVTSIGVYAFSGCTGMTTITIPGSVTSIGNYAFYHCSKLAEISIPNSVTSVGDYVFLDCYKLEKVVIPESISSISAYTFQGCKALASVNIPGSITTIGKGAFYSSGLTSVSIPNSVTSIGQYAFYDCDSLSQISIPESVISIDSYAFSECGALGTVTIPNSVIYLGSHAFYNSDGLKQIVIPESLSLIRDYTFYDCDGLTEVAIPNSVTSIGEQAFYYCYNLVSLTLGSNLSSIGNRAFYKCSDLNVIHVTGSIPPSLYDSDVFYQVNKSIPVYVPTGCVEAYKKASYWSSFSTILEEENTEPLPDGARLYVDNVYYLVKSSVDRTLCVTYKGDSYSSYSDEYYGEIVIPDSVTFHGVTYAVTEIGAEAFRGCAGLITLTIGKNIKSIGNSAFYNCTKLRKLTLQDGESTLELGYNSNYNNGLFYYSTIDTLYIGRNLSYQYAPFYNIEELQSVTIGDKVTRIGNSLFSSCYALTSVTMGKNVTAIGNSAFYNCDGLKEITIPNSVTTIDDNAFYDCDGLTDITIPDSVTSIGNYAFYYCSNLTDVTVGGGVTSIGNSAFYNCTKLKKLTLQDGESTLELGYNSNYNNGLFYYSTIDTLYIGRNLSYQYAPFKNIEELKSVTIGDNVTRIGNSIFYNCTALSSVAIGKNVTAIGNSAFYNCDGLTEITIPNSVTTIGEYAFYDCDGLTEITIPDSITSIGNNVFSECSNLMDVTVGGGVTSIGDNAFYYCTKLRKLTLQDGKATLSLGTNGGSSGLFGNCPIDTLYLGRNLSYQYTPFERIEELKSVTIGDNVTRITNSVFRYCTALSSVSMGKNVTEIGISAFRDCDGLTSVSIPNGLTTIDDNAFYDCDGLKEITIPDSVITIGTDAFRDCDNLTDVTIGNSVTSIGNSVFYNCSNLAEIHVKATTPPTLANGDVFYNVNKSIPVYVPAGCASAYRNATYWKAFTNIIALSDDVFVSGGIYYKITSEEEGTVAVTFCGGTYNEYTNEYTGTVAIPESVTHNEVVYKVTSIANEAFRNCTTLTKVDIPESITSISDYAFATCTGLTTVTIGNGVAAIGNRAFEDCHALKSISIPQGVTSIGNYAFSTCIGLTEITIPGSVTSIGIGALAGCSGINSIAVEEGNTMYDSRDNCNAIVETATNKLIAGCKNSVIPGSVTAIGDYAFSGVTGLRTILIPKDVTSIGVSAFSGCSGLEEIGVEAVVPPTIVATTFDGVNKSIPVYVPAGCAEVYRNVEYWQEFTNIKEVAIIVNGIHYKITSAENKTMAITSRGDGNDKYAGVVEIPQSVIYNDVTYKVTSIGEKAFMDCTDLTSVVIPNSITSISQSAFFGCTGLTEMTIPNSVTSIGIGALAGCSGVNSIVVEEGNTMYDSRDNCNAIVETATNTLIAGCNNTVIPADVVSIGEGAFYGCSGLISITIPEGVALIGASAFEDCIGLTEMHVNAINPPAVRVNTFSNVDKTIPVYVPEGCASVYHNAVGWREFTNIIGLPQGVFTTNNIYYKITSEENKTVEVTFKGSTYYEHAGEYTGEVAIPASVVYNDITYSVTSIGRETFRGCTALTSVTIPEGVTSIGKGAFYNSYALTSVTIPASVTLIGEYAFVCCAGLGTIVVEEGNEVYDSRDNCNAIIETTTNTLIVGCQNTAIPESVTAISEGAFYGCSSLISITIPEGVTSIGDNAFYGCSELIEIRIDATTPPTIYSATFSSVSRSIPVHVPLHCAEVYSNAEYWSEFTNIIAPAPLAIVKTTPGEGEEVDSFSGIVVEFNKPVYIANEAGATVKDAAGETVATLTVVGDESPATKVRLYIAEPIHVEGVYTVNIPAEMFATDGNEEYNANTVVNFTVKLPTLSEGTALEVDGVYYKVTSSDNRTVEVTFKGSTYYEYTDEYTGEVEIPENVTFKGVKYSVTAIGQSAFKDCASLTSVVIPGSVTSIGGEAFEGCAVLSSVAMSDSIITIGDYAFCRCSSLTSITIPPSVSVIGVSVFRSCLKLKTVVLPQSITSIGESAFYYCIGLTSITIGNRVSTIGDYAFYYCTGLTEIHVNSTTPPIVSSNTFYNVDKSIPVYVPSGSAEAYRNAIYWREFNDIKDVEINIDGIYYKVTSSDNRTVEVTYKGDTYDEYTHEYTGSIVIPESITYNGVTYSVTSIGRYAFNGCSSLASVDIPNSVTSLGGAAFEGCTALYSVTIGNGVTAIGDYTFYKCTTLTSVTIPEKVATIGQSAFQACSSLREIISAAITPPTVKTNTFNQVDKSIPVYVPEWSVDNYRKASFWNQFTNIIGVANGVIVVNGVYYKKTSDEDKTVEVTFCGRSYDEYAGEYTGELEIPDSVTYQGVVYSVTAIGKSAFKGCTSLTSVVIPGSVAEIGGAAFEGCTALNSVTIGNAVTAIGDYAFYKCVALTSVTIPENVVVIGQSAFQACTGFVEIVSEAITPPTIESTTFSYVDKSISLYVPGGCADAYSMADYWSEFTYIEEIGAVNEVSFAAETIKVGAMKEFSLPISMKNSMPVVGVQCDIELPDGLTAVKNNGNYEVTLSSRANDYRVETILRQDGLLRVLIYPKSVSPIVIYDEELYIIKNSYIDKQESAQSAQEKNLEYPTAPKPISGRNGELFTITLMPNEHYSTNDNVVIRNAEAITRSYSIQEIADLVIACTVQGDATGDESDVSDIDNVESATRIYAADNKIVIESPQAQKAQIIMMDGLVLRKFLQPGHNEIPMQQGIYIVSVGSIAKKIVIR